MQLADHIRVSTNPPTGRRDSTKTQNTASSFSGLNGGVSTGLTSDPLCPRSVYPECLGLHGGGGRSPAGVPAYGSGEGRPRRVAEGPGDFLQRHPTVLQEDSPQDAGNRRAGHPAGTQLWPTGNHGNRTSSLSTRRLICLFGSRQSLLYFIMSEAFHDIL